MANPDRQPDIAEVYADLVRAAQALSDYRAEIVLAGGLVPLCYRHLFSTKADAPAHLMTFDIDWAVLNEIPLRQGRTIRQAIEAAGYREVLSQFVVPPVAKYQHERFDDKTPAPVYLDFITDRPGGPTSRTGRDLTKLDVQADFKVVALPFVRLLTENSLTFDLASLPQLHLDAPCDVMIPQPACYALHKLLVSQRRSDAAKRDKDLAYVYDLAVASHDHWQSIKDELDRLKAAKRIPAAWWLNVSKIATRNFNDATSDGPVSVARIYATIGTTVSESNIQRVMARFFRALGFSTKGAD
jgi:hypothetical protein